MSTAATGNIDVRVSCDLSSYPCLDDPLAHILVELCPNFHGPETRAVHVPVDVIMLLDVSLSMQSPRKYPLVRQAVDVLIERLAPEDHLALVLFSQGSFLLSPLVASSSLRKRRAELLRQMDDSPVTFGGHTRMAPGLLSCLEQIQSRSRASAIGRVYCLTDGELDDAPECQSLISELNSRKIELQIYGFGNQFNVDQIRELIGQTSRFYIKSIVDTSQVTATFSNLAARAADAVASELTVSFEIIPEAVCGDLFQFRPQERWLGPLRHSGTEVFVSSIEQERIYSFLLEVRLSPDAAGATTTLGEVELCYRLGGESEFQIERSTFQVSRSRQPGQSVRWVTLARDVLRGLRDKDHDDEVRRIAARWELARAERRDPALIAALQRQLDILRTHEAPPAPLAGPSHAVATSSAEADTAPVVLLEPPPKLDEQDRLYLSTDFSTQPMLPCAQSLAELQASADAAVHEVLPQLHGPPAPSSDLSATALSARERVTGFLRRLGSRRE